MMYAVLEIARHELAVSLRTARALVVAALYVAATLIGATAVTFSVRILEQKATEALVAKGMDPLQAALALSLFDQDGYRKLFAFFAGVPSDQLAESLSTSVLVPFLFWGALVFLPFLILLTSYDQPAADLSSRAICYTTVRAPRSAVLLGKLLAQATLFVGITILCAAAVVGLGTGLLATFSLGEVLPGLLRMVVLLIPFGFCYLGIAAFCSASARQPFTALVASFGVIFALWVLGMCRHLSPDYALGFLRYLTWLSPSTYRPGLWMKGVWAPLGSAAAFLGFAAAFVLLASRRLGKRDL